MERIKRLLKKFFLPITIMLVPHSNAKHLSFRMPFAGVLLCICLFFSFSVYLIRATVDLSRHQAMEQRLNYYQKQFDEINGSIQVIRKAEKDFKNILSSKSEDKILESIDFPESGSVDIDALREQIQPTVETVTKIKEFLRQQKDMYLSVPRGLPVSGRISSPFGMRESSDRGRKEFHPAIDILAEKGTPVKATADGVVSFSGWAKGSGNIVAIEHGFGYSTYYAHNKINKVGAGQRVRRGDIIAYVGSTGNATGPHSHYEIRENGKPIDPQRFLAKGRK